MSPAPARIRAFVAGDSATVTAYFDVKRVGTLHAAGVRMLVGTDTPLPYVVPGVSVHDEMDLLVRRAQPTPGTGDERAGTVSGRRHARGDPAGAAADVVLVDADPFLDVRNPRRRRMVVARGGAHERVALNSLRARVERVVRGRE
jgi:hypothetical protein